jgi:hypothetical protein
MSRYVFVFSALTAAVLTSFAAQAQTKPTIPAAFETRYCEADAVDYLKAKIKNGGQGVWGNIPMPASAAATDAEIAELAEWILKIGK